MSDQKSSIDKPSRLGLEGFRGLNASSPEIHGELWSPAARAAVLRFSPGPKPWRTAWAFLLHKVSLLVMRGMNSVVVINRETFDSVHNKGRGLLTFSNHVSLFDDPFLTACFSSYNWQPLRWIAADAINFFGNPVYGELFNGGKCVPIVRGAGQDQPGMKYLAERLQAGDWVHVFPEGGRTRDPKAHLRQPLKGGMAQLIQESEPLLLPFSHLGMQKILPIGSFLPRMGHKVRLEFGEVTDSAQGLSKKAAPEITAWAEQQLLDLQARALADDS